MTHRGVQWMDRLTTRRGSVRTAGLLLATGALSAIAGACSPGDCIRTGPSAVEFSVPAGWQTVSYCLDDTCLPQSELFPTSDSFGPPAILFEVTDSASEYDYLIEVRSPDGELFTYEGDVETVGIDFGGESCTPTMYVAGLSINRNGELTTQWP
jgi:hypothetical protein